uniref:PH domain-containing protein n=1 Tax=Lotharella oceanica TaxID=641309 RepID=A0A7S2X8X0_9EUKA|mmetsp:Transcript_14574/g.27627  ORF Transcript_14574/g.27627 Transcript_14574/m.27627 type:complete len:295 (+) Transcript_14574:452-1336(+)
MPPLSDWLDTWERDAYRRRFIVCDTTTGMLEILPRENGKPLRVLTLLNATVQYDYSYKEDPRVLCIKFQNDANDGKELMKLVLHHEDWERVRHWARYISRFIDLLKEEEMREAAEGFMSSTFMGSSMFDLKNKVVYSQASSELWKPWKALRDMAIYDSPDLFNSMGGPGVEIGDIVYARKVVPRWLQLSNYKWLPSRSDSGVDYFQPLAPKDLPAKEYNVLVVDVCFHAKPEWGTGDEALGRPKKRVKGREEIKGWIRVLPRCLWLPIHYSPVLDERKNPRRVLDCLHEREIEM